MKHWQIKVTNDKIPGFMVSNYAKLETAMSDFQTFCMNNDHVELFEFDETRESIRRWSKNDPNHPK